MNHINYPVGDFLIQLKNASLAKKSLVEVPSTGLVKAVAKLMEKEGFLEEVKENKKILKVRLTQRKKEAVLTDVRLVSKPGLRVYMKASELEKIKGPSIFIVSTAKGIMSSKDAIKKRLGGEIIAEIL